MGAVSYEKVIGYRRYLQADLRIHAPLLRERPSGYQQICHPTVVVGGQIRPVWQRIEREARNPLAVRAAGFQQPLDFRWRCLLLGVICFLQWSRPEKSAQTESFNGCCVAIPRESLPQGGSWSTGAVVAERVSGLQRTLQRLLVR